MGLWTVVLLSLILISMPIYHMGQKGDKEAVWDAQTPQSHVLAFKNHCGQMSQANKLTLPCTL